MTSRPQIEAVLLCAGLGKRLRPLTESVPKAMIPVGGTPLIDVHLSALRQAGVERAVLVVGYLADRLRGHVGNGSRFDLSVDYVVQEKLGGTGDALHVAEQVIRNERFLLLYGDTYFGPRPDVFHRLLENPTAKIAAAEVASAGTYGRLRTETRDGRTILLGIQEKDGQPTPGLINAGAYFLPRSVLSILRDLPPSPRGEIELTDAIVKLAREVEPIHVVKVTRWIDIGTPEQLAAAGRIASVDRTSGTSVGQP